jgi:hypothetical protein
MVLGLLWIVGMYALCVGIAHLLFVLFQRHPKKLKHYVLVTNNVEQHIEWYLGSLFLFSWLKGTEYKVTVVDEGSTDETLAIIQKLSSKRHMGIAVYTTPYHKNQYMQPRHNEEMIVVELNKAEDLSKLPSFQ